MDQATLTSTLSVQGKDFLDDHLTSVVQQIIAEKQILLQIIGIDRDLPNLLANAITVTDRKLARPVFNTIRAKIT
jgi:cobalamin biosynthesis protein CobT